MKATLNHLYRFFILIILAITIQACGSDTPDPVAGYSISADMNRIHFTHEYLKSSDESFSVAINYTGDGLLLGYAPDTQPVPWLKFRTENLTSTSAKIIVELSNVANYQQNFYQTKLRLSTGDVNNVALVHKDIDISLLVSAQPSFSAVMGDTSVVSQTLDIALDSADWTFDTDIDWLAIDTLTTDGISTLTVTPSLNEVNQAGLYQGNITLTENSSGDIITIPVELGLDPLYLVPSKTTISLTKALNIQALTQTIKIATNRIDTIDWQVSSNQPWLLVEKKDANSINVSVDNNQMPTESFNSALITVSAIDNPSVINAEIPVSFYFSELNVQNTVLEQLEVNNNALVADVNHPYFFTAVDNELRTYHQYTGQLINSVAVSPEGSLLEQLIIHPLGTFILAKADVSITNNDETITTTHRYKINLADNTVTELLASTIEYEPIKFVTFDARHFVVTQALEFADDNLNRLYWDSENAFVIADIDQANETDTLYALDATTSAFKKITAQVNDYTASKIVPTISQEYRPESLPENESISQFVVSDDESALYLISSTSELITIDGENYTDKGLLTQAEDSTTITVNKDKWGNIAYTRFAATGNEGIVVDFYDRQGTHKNTIITNGQLPQAITVTQDSKQLIIKANSQIELIALDSIALSEKNLTFLSTLGDTDINEQIILLTDVNSNWQATSNVDWLILSANTQNNEISLVVDIDTTSITSTGILVGVITITDPDTGRNIQSVVELAIDEVRLFANYPALSFDQQLDRELLSQTVKIQSNRNNAPLWQAASNVDWLSLIENTTDNTLTITVDPTMVATHGIHYGNITLSSLTIGEALAGTISVSFTKGDYDSSLQSEISLEDVTPNTRGVVLDPLRPYIYVAQLDHIDVYNLIDGSKVTSINSPLPAVDLTNLVIHPDGSILLASNVETYLDDQEEEQIRVNHYQIDLADFTLTQLDADLIDLTYRPNNIVIIEGQAFVISQAMEYANLSLEVQLWDASSAFLSATMHKVPNNNSVLAYDENSSSIIEHSVDYNANAKNPLHSIVKSSYFNTNFIALGLAGITSSNDGTHLYTANGASEWATLTNDSYIDNGALPSSQTISTIKVVTDSADNSYVYRRSFINGFGEAHTLTQYDSQQQLLDYSAYTAGSNNVLISPSYHRLIHFAGEKLVIDFMK